MRSKVVLSNFFFIFNKFFNINFSITHTQHKLNLKTKIKRFHQIILFTKSQQIILKTYHKFIQNRSIMRKNQLRKLSLQNLSRISFQQENGENLTMIKEVIDEKNDSLSSRTNQMKKQLENIRKQIKKTIKQMNDVVKQQLSKREKIVMDKNSRPTEQLIKELTDNFALLENQNFLIRRNNQTVDKISTVQLQKESQLMSTPKTNFSQLDKEYNKLKLECEKQQKKLNEQNLRLQTFKSHLDSIENTIDNYRLQYQVVEDMIRQQEKELDHLVTYFKNRNQQDQQNLRRETRLSQVIETELLKNQYFLNANAQKAQILQIIQNQKHLQNL